ncbi:MAG: hypothetical protein JSV17_12970 [Candidatus Aminicenantes bacterium]|nr:MAG: hypothetical protein JSV17_12970 [Candidatus Aminicenantes bacterium]
MDRKRRLLVCGALFLFFFTHSYMWSGNKKIQKKGENLKKEQLRKKNEQYEGFLRRIQGEVKKSLKEKTSRHVIKPGYSHIDPDFAYRAPKDEKVIFTQDIPLEKKKLKTRLDVKLGKTRKVTQITKEISFDKWKAQYNYNAKKKLHSFKGVAEIASFDAHVVINNKQKPAFSVSRPIKISESVKVVPSGKCNFENKNIGFGLTGSVNKNFTAAVFIDRSPVVRKMEYSFKGAIHNIVNIRLQGRTVCRPENPRESRATHNGTLIKKLGKHVSVQAGLQYENSTITNPSFSFVYSRMF